MGISWNSVKPLVETGELQALSQTWACSLFWTRQISILKNSICNEWSKVLSDFALRKYRFYISCIIKLLHDLKNYKYWQILLVQVRQINRAELLNWLFPEILKFHIWSGELYCLKAGAGVVITSNNKQTPSVVLLWLTGETHWVSRQENSRRGRISQVVRISY